MHYLFFCTKFKGQRNRLKKELKRGRELDVGILGEKKSIPAVFRYIEATKRFEDSHGSFSGYDEEIDSDAGFEESDEEQFADFFSKKTHTDEEGEEGDGDGEASDQDSDTGSDKSKLYIEFLMKLL
ncbi:hypothetical protein BYT27DRAFT_7241209 [Phlegmacium glaucopus]|nr:hypothetical protein BYT27DRAFT_7241209 [Phlegmacium glaucopus]